MNSNIEFKIFNGKRDTPVWLKKIVGQNYLHDLSEISMGMHHCKIEDILEDSCFYYCSGSDITPIIALEGYLYSFIYSDNCLYQNYDDALSKLKDKLRKKGFKQIQKSNIDLSFFRLHKSDLTRINLPDNKQIQHPIPSGEFGIWKSGKSLFSLLYLCWDDICVWKNLYDKKQIFPSAICNYRPENSNMFNDRDFIVWKENNLPQYVIGHANHLGTIYFTEIGRVEYFGDYEIGDSVCIPLYEKIANS